VAEAGSGQEALRFLGKVACDVAFLDVRMPGCDGFQVVETTPSIPMPLIVLVTAHSQFALRAFDAQVLDYLLKPVGQERFDVAMDRIREALRHRRALAGNEQLTRMSGVDVNVAATAAPASTLVVPTDTGDLVLDVRDVDWIEAQDYYAAIHALGRRYLVRESLNDLEIRLDPAQFIRVHRSAIVRVDRIRELTTTEGVMQAVLRDGSRVSVSRRRRHPTVTQIRRKPWH
jgi:two-component system LytT family response regulator